MSGDAVSGVVSASRPETAAAGLEVLKQGGNAVDAAVAAVIASCVVTPDNVAIGGYGGCMVIYQADKKKVAAIDFDSCAPLAFRPGLYKNDDAARVGYLSISVPGVVAGLALVLEKFGTMSWKKVSSRAYKLAEEGFKVTPTLAAALKNLAKTTDPTSLKAQFPDGKIPEAGDVFIQKDLAALIKRIGEEGPEAFYSGEISAKIVKQVKEHGGLLSEEDFYEYRARVIEPISIRYKGYEVYAPPPPSGALSSLQVLKMMECLEQGKANYSGTSYYHAILESLKLAWTDRQKYFGDPDFVDVPIDMLLSDKHTTEYAARISPDKLISNQTPAAPASHTVHVVSCDSKRNMVSLTATQGEPFGSKVVIDGLGLAMGHGMSRFDFIPGHPNYPEPGKRMQHNMCSVIILKDGKPFSAIGLPGGRKIVSVTPQLIMNLLDHRMSVSKAISAPRVHTDGSGPVQVSKTLPDGVFSELKRIGHNATRVATVGGPATGLVIEGDSGRVSAASEAGDSCVGSM